MRSRRGSWNVDRGMGKEDGGVGSEEWGRRRSKGGKIHCHCQNKFSFWNPLKISFEAKLLEKCKRRTKKLNKNTQKIRKNWRRRRRPSREAKGKEEGTRESERRGAQEELSWATAAEKTGKNWKYYKTFVIISVAFIVGAPRLSLALLTFPFSWPPYPAFNTGQLFSIYSPILQLLESGEKVKFLSPIAINAARRVGVDLRTNPNRNPTHNTTQHTQQHTTTHTQQRTQGNTNRGRTEAQTEAQTLDCPHNCCANRTWTRPCCTLTTSPRALQCVQWVQWVCVGIRMVYRLWISHRMSRVGWCCGICE